MLEVAGEVLGADGLGGRVSVRQLSVDQLESTDEFDVVSMNIVFHELAPAIRQQAMAAMYRALRPDGVLISNDFLYPNRREDFREPKYALGVFDQALEMAWGSRHLSRDQIHDLFMASGFRRCEFREIPLPFPSLVRPGNPVVYLTALAFK
jgi:SAM-dependent methyltransferase